VEAVVEGLPGLLVQEFWTDPVQALLRYRAAERVRRAPWHPEGFSHLLPTAYQAVLETERGGLELLPKERCKGISPHMATVDLAN